MKSDFKIGIIGGNGSMGRSLKKFFQKNGFKVYISDIDSKLTNSELTEISELIILSVPLNLYSNILNEIAPFLNKNNHVLMDIGSLKVNQIKIMKKYFKGTIFPIHPLFGPDKNFQKGETIIVCEHDNHYIIDTILSCFENQQLNIVKLTSEEHDEIMSYMHSFYYFINISYLKMLKEKFNNLSSIENFKTTSFKHFEKNLANIFNTPLWLIESLMYENPFFNQRIKEFSKILELKKIDIKEIEDFVYGYN